MPSSFAPAAIGSTRSTRPKSMTLTHDGCVELRRRLRLALEAAVELVGAGEDRVQHLDRDEPLGLDVLALVDRADAALAEPLA